MSRPAFALPISDLAAFARSVRAQLSPLGPVPSHLEMLNILSRAAGYQNFQHFRADAEAGAATPAVADAASTPPAPVADLDKVAKLARYFDADGVMTSWPARTNHQSLAMWVMWSRLPPRQQFSEIQISELLDLWHGFGDRALLRRSMVDGKLVERTRDGRAYWRVEREPPPELGPLLKRIAGAKA